jgi:hypothetical protein
LHGEVLAGSRPGVSAALNYESYKKSQLLYPVLKQILKTEKLRDRNSSAVKENLSFVVKIHMFLICRDFWV